MAVEAKKKPGRVPRDSSCFPPRLVVDPPEPCPDCLRLLTICQHRKARLQTLKERCTLVMKDRQCRNPDCSGPQPIFRPVEHTVPRLKDREYGLDVICYVGKRYQEDGMSFPRIHKELTDDHGVLISARHVPNLFKLFLALIHCRNGDVDVVRERLRNQGELVIQIDAIRLDETSPPLYVIREVISEEVLFAERIEFPSTDNLAQFLRRVLPIGVPITGVLTDKEQALVLAVEKAFPGVPHQICHTHYLKNLVKPMEKDLAQLSSGIQDVVRKVRDLEKKINGRRAAEAAGVDVADADEVSRPDQDENQVTEDAENPVGESPDETHPPEKVDGAAEETQIAKTICTIVKTIGQCRGDAIVDPPALKRFTRLMEATQQLKTALARKKSSWPLLSQLLAALLTLNMFGELAKRLQLQLGIVREIAHILHMKSSGRQVKRVLRTYLNRLRQGAPHRGRGAPRGKYIDGVVAISDRFWKGLFACYDHPRLPANNNSLERYFGEVRQHQRRVHGRKSTSGGPLEALAPLLLQAWDTLDREPNLLALLDGIPPDEVKRAQEVLAQFAEPARLKRSIARDPMTHLAKALAGVRRR